MNLIVQFFRLWKLFISTIGQNKNSLFLQTHIKLLWINNIDHWFAWMCCCVQCTAVPSTLTLWIETKWSNPLLIRNLRWEAEVTGIWRGKTNKTVITLQTIVCTTSVNVMNNMSSQFRRFKTNYITAIILWVIINYG